MHPHGSHRFLTARCATLWGALIRRYWRMDVRTGGLDIATNAKRQVGVPMSSNAMPSAGSALGPGGGDDRAPGSRPIQPRRPSPSRWH
jgi:hypothetical protein